MCVWAGSEPGSGFWQEYLSVFPCCCAVVGLARCVLQAQGAMQQQMADKLVAVLEHLVQEVGVGG